MWAQENRSKHQQVRTALKRGYPTDVKNEEWRLIASPLSRQEKTRRPRKTDLNSHQCAALHGAVRMRMAYAAH